ncbi:Flocculation suppression protein [Basidiobolus ranarum]
MIAWERSGTRFIIKDPINFASKVLPQYYMTNKLASFSRQLNIYGFYRVSDRRRNSQCSDTSMIIYVHQHFKRDKLDSLHLIKRMASSYPRATFRLSKLQVHGSKSKSVPSTISPISTSSLNSLATCQHECGVKCAAVAAHACMNCKILTQEIVNLNRTIEYYKSIVHEPSILDEMNYTNYQDFCSPDMSLSLYSTNALPFSLEKVTSDENTYSSFNLNHCSQLVDNIEM